MANENGRERDTLVVKLHKHTYRFEFHQAMRLLERYYAHFSQPGSAKSIHQEMLQFKSRVFLSAPPGDLYSFNDQGNGGIWGKPVLEVNFLGIAGLQGPLPTPFTELLLERNKAKDYAMDDFLQIFNHRLISMHRRIYKKMSIAAQDEMPDKTVIGKAVKSIAGIGLESLSHRNSFDDVALMNVAGLIWQRPVSASKLAHIIAHFFNVSVKIKPFIPQWKLVLVKDRTSLGKTGRYKVLGKSSFLGGRLWNQESGMIVHIGPVSLDVYKTFLPPMRAHQQLIDLVRFFTTPETDVWMNIELIGKQVPGSVLGEKPILGQLSALKSQSIAGEPSVVAKFKV